MSDRLTALLELRASALFDVDVDGRLLIGNNETGSVQLYELAPRSDRPRPLTRLAEPCSGRYLPGGRQVVVSTDAGGSERAQLYLLDADADADADGAGVPELRPLVLDAEHIHSLLDVAPDTVVYATNRRNGVDFDVVVRTVSTGQERVAWDGGGWFEAARLSPDGRYLALARMTLLAASSQLLLLELGTGAHTSLTDPDLPGDWALPAWLSPGVVLASSDAGDEYHSVRTWDDRAPVGTGWVPLLTAGGADRWGFPSPDGRWLAVVSTVDGSDLLEVHELVDGHLGAGIQVALPGDGTITQRYQPVWSPDGATLGLTFSSPVQPPEVYTWSAPSSGLDAGAMSTGVVPGASVVRRTESNPADATQDLLDPVSHLVPTPDGEQVPVYLFTPAAPDGSAVLVIHGGPEAAAVRSWDPLVAGLALAGHTVVVPNVRGSSGYGRRWLSMDDGPLRLDSVADLTAIADWLPSVGADPARAALVGGSYGGYMVLAGLAFQPDRWAAGVDVVGISSLVTFLENTSPYRRAYREREYGVLATDRDMLAAASPMTRIDDIRAPLFVIHGANDPRVPLSEAQQLVGAVRSRGVEAELMVFDDEGHGLAKRANRLAAYPAAAAFLARHLS